MTVKVAFWPAASVVGRERPLALKPVPVTLACETVAGEVPVLLRVTVCELLPFTATVPKLMLAGLAESSTVTPFPARETVVGELEASLTSVILPVTLPAAWGAKVTETAALCPALKVRGSESPLRLKPFPVTVA